MYIIRERERANNLTYLYPAQFSITLSIWKNSMIFLVSKAFLVNAIFTLQASFQMKKSF